MDVEGASITQRDDFECEAARPLSEVLADAPFPRLVRAFAEACRIVERAHARGVVHGELSPACIRVGALGDVHVVGWGPAPAQATGAADVARDVFALGCILSDLLARGDAPPELAAACARAVAADRTARTSTARELAEHVLAYLDGDRDVDARRALAAVHFERAFAAFASQDPISAMRDATRALALDPQFPGAAELVGRLMLEPPKVMPAQVADLIAADRVEEIRRQSRGAIPVFVAYLLFAPAFFWLGSGEFGYAAALIALVAAAVGALYLQGYRGAPPRPWLVAACNVALIALSARAGSPFLLGPGIAVVTVVGIAFSPVYADPRKLVAVVLAIFAGVLAPFLAERAGWISETMTPIHHGLAFTGPALNLRPAGQSALLVLYTLTLVIAGAGLASQVARGERTLRHRLMLQTYLLKDLVR
jgi:serine/threonine-protein kinase